MPFIPPQYRYLALGLALVAYTLGVVYISTNHERRAWVARIEAQKAEAAQALADATERNRQIEAEHAAQARTIDEKHAAEMADALASRDDFAERLRLARRRAGSCSGVPSPTPTAGVSENPAGSGDDGPREPDPAITLRDASLSLQSYAKACHSWATSVGR